MVKFVGEIQMAYSLSLPTGRQALQTACISLTKIFHSKIKRHVK
jgi:hypothetical protein